MPYAVAGMLRCLLTLVLVFGAVAPVAQAQHEAGGELTDDELIRWAAREVGRADGRTLGAHPPVPPYLYLSSGEPGVFRGPSPDRVLGRLVAELAGGALGVFVGGGVGTMLVWAAIEGDANPDTMAIAMGAGTVLGALGLTAGVTLAAELTGGRGNFGHAFLGQMLGSAAALPLIVYGLRNDAPIAALIAGGLLPIAGAMLGYEIGHSERSSGPSISPFVTPSQSGASAGVAGSLP